MPWIFLFFRFGIIGATLYTLPSVKHFSPVDARYQMKGKLARRQHWVSAWKKGGIYALLKFFFEWNEHGYKEPLFGYPSFWKIFLSPKVHAVSLKKKLWGAEIGAKAFDAMAEPCLA